MTTTNWTNPANRAELEAALDARKLYVRMGNERYWLARRNGKTQTWKTEPHRFRIPIKAGYLATGQITQHSSLDTFRIADSNDLANANQTGGRAEDVVTDRFSKQQTAGVEPYGRGFDRMKENLGPEKAEALRLQVLKDQQAALANVERKEVQGSKTDRTTYRDYPNVEEVDKPKRKTEPFKDAGDF